MANKESKTGQCSSSIFHFNIFAAAPHNATHVSRRPPFKRQAVTVPEHSINLSQNLTRHLSFLLTSHFVSCFLNFVSEPSREVHVLSLHGSDNSRRGSRISITKANKQKRVEVAPQALKVYVPPSTRLDRIGLVCPRKILYFHALPCLRLAGWLVDMLKQPTHTDTPWAEGNLRRSREARHLGKQAGKQADSQANSSLASYENTWC